MIKHFKSFLRLRYVSRNEDIEKQRFEVKNIAWLNFSYGEEVDDNGELQLVPHPESVFVRFQINPKEVTRKISFVKKKQATELRPEFLTTLREERKPVREDLKRSCVRLAQNTCHYMLFGFTNLSRRLMNLTTIMKCRKKKTNCFTEKKKKY